MSFHFLILAPPAHGSVPLFEHTFGTSRSGGDGVSRFQDAALALNPLVAHAALDALDDAMWGSGALYLKLVDRFQSTYVFAFVTAANARFVLLACPEADRANAVTGAGASTPGSAGLAGAAAAAAGREARSGLAASMSSASAAWGGVGSTSFSAYAYPGGGSGGWNATSPASEEAVKSFFQDVYDSWVKAVMSPFYQKGMPVRSPVFRSRVAAAARKYL
jgi:trafficking protein particle complex subunit 2